MGSLRWEWHHPKAKITCHICQAVPAGLTSLHNDSQPLGERELTSPSSTPAVDTERPTTIDETTALGANFSDPLASPKELQQVLSANSSRDQHYQALHPRKLWPVIAGSRAEDHPHPPAYAQQLQLCLPVGHIGAQAPLTSTSFMNHGWSYRQPHPPGYWSQS